MVGSTHAKTDSAALYLAGVVAMASRATHTQTDSTGGGLPWCLAMALRTCWLNWNHVRVHSTGIVLAGSSHTRAHTHSHTHTHTHTSAHTVITPTRTEPASWWLNLVHSGYSYGYRQSQISPLGALCIVNNHGLGQKTLFALANAFSGGCSWRVLSNRHGAP